MFVDLGTYKHFTPNGVKNCDLEHFTLMGVISLRDSLVLSVLIN